VFGSHGRARIEEMPTGDVGYEPEAAPRELPQRVALRLAALMSRADDDSLASVALWRVISARAAATSATACFT